MGFFGLSFSEFKLVFPNKYIHGLLTVESIYKSVLERNPLELPDIDFLFLFFQPILNMISGNEHIVKIHRDYQRRSFLLLLCYGMMHSKAFAEHLGEGEKPKNSSTSYSQQTMSVALPHFIFICFTYPTLYSINTKLLSTTEKAHLF